MVPILYVYTALSGENAGTRFSMSMLYYEDCNKMFLECSFNDTNDTNYTFPGFLHCSVNSSTPFSFFPVNQHHFGCGTITLLTKAKNYWNISLVLQGCDQVQLQCGNNGAGGKSLELSSPLTLGVLQGKEACCTKFCPAVCATLHVQPHSVVYIIIITASELTHTKFSQTLTHL